MKKIWQIAFSVVCVLAGLVLGLRYISRLPNHDGYYLVAVEDEIGVAAPERPRHTVLIVVDGLRLDAAETMASARRLADAGQCRVSDQGTYTVSRPEYVLLSAGLEVDRSGARNNENTKPVAVESVWDVARRHGLTVGGSSHLPWFRELFPNGFDRFTVFASHADDVFQVDDLLDVNEFHPLYVDESAHHHGATSPEHAAAVARAALEMGQLLDRLDLTRDLVVLTADHGHRDAGGHGGAQPEIRYVLACFAGRGVAKVPMRPPFDGRVTGPAIALMLGIPFPRNMRAGEDGLDVLWEIIAPTPQNQAYLEDRRAAVERFRAANKSAIEGWMGGGPGTWTALYAHEKRAQTLRALPVSLALLVPAIVRVRAARREGCKRALLTMGWLLLTAAIFWAVHRAVLGEFDYSVINIRTRFIPRAFGIAFCSLALAVVAHRLLLSSTHGAHDVSPTWKERLRADVLVIAALLLVMNVGHVAVYGWPLGFPLPSAPARYFPFFGAIALATTGLLAFILSVISARASLRDSSINLDEVR